MRPEIHVAKFGGTSMSRPDTVLSIDNLHNFHSVVVSAPGIDQNNPEKVTSMLLDYAQSNQPRILDGVISRFESIASQLNLSEVDKIVRGIPKDLQDWTDRRFPVAGLGELWSGKIYSAVSGRELIDPCDIIRFRDDGWVSSRRTSDLISSRLLPKNKYVIPGFYGSSPSGGIKLFERGGSDISGALIARGLKAKYYHNWSDVDGFYCADPRLVHSAKLIPRLTYREARELGNGGTGLLHREVIRVLGNTSIETHMHNTFGDRSEPGTVINRERSWSTSSVVGVTGIKDMVGLSVFRHGMQSAIGDTTSIYATLANFQIPYEHTATATDNVTVYLQRKHEAKLRKVSRILTGQGSKVNLHDATMLHVVGEGLVQSNAVRLRTIAKIVAHFADNNITLLGLTDVADSAALTFFIKPDNKRNSFGRLLEFTANTVL